MRITRRRFLAALGFGGAGFAADMRLFEPHALTIGRHEIALGFAGKRPPLRLLHLSDFHASDCVSLGFIEESVRLGLSLEPDLVCLTGDFISWRWEAWERYAHILAMLAQRAPSFACLGNHDGGRWAASSRHRGYPDTAAVRALLAQAGVELLHNASRTPHIGGGPLTLVGVGDLWAHELDADAAFADVPAETVKILLNHNPDAKDKVAAHDWQLMLSGHTHGGQCRLPFLGTPFAPVGDLRFVEWLREWRGRWIYVTRGVGNLHGLRFNCRPEVSLLTLV